MRVWKRQADYGGDQRAKIKSIRHVHVYREGKFVLKWDLEKQKPMKGVASREIIELIKELESEERI